MRMYSTYISSIKFDSIRIPVSRDITNLKKINHIRDVKNIILHDNIAEKVKKIIVQ